MSIATATRRLAVVGLLGALVAVLGLTPIGFVPVPTPAGSATTLHIPAILAGILEGPLAGAAVGFMFGAFSFWRAVTAPANPVAAAMFSEPFTAFAPRILIGVVAFYAFRLAAHARARPYVAAVLGLVVADLVYRLPVWGVQTSVRDPWVAVPPQAWLAALAGGLLAAWASYRALGHAHAAPALAAIAGTLTNTVGVLTLVTLRGVIPPQVALGIAILHGLPEVLVATVLTVLVYGALVRTGVRPAGVAAGPGGA